MARKKRSSGLGNLGDVFKTRKRGKSALAGLGASFKNRRSKRKRGGLMAASGFGNKKGSGGLMGTYNSTASTKRTRRGIEAQAFNSFRERMTRSEFLKVRDEIDETVNNDQILTTAKEDNRMLENMPWYRRMIVLATKRFRKPVL